MWLFTALGFFSIVEKPNDRAEGKLTVRGRVREDLAELRRRYLPSMSKILADAGTDYKFRARVDRDELAAAMRQMVLDLDYANFKAAVVQNQGPARGAVYHEVWDVVCALQQDNAPAPIPSMREVSYGGVIFDGEGQVLLRRPVGNFDGYVWTFAKGKARRGETAAGAALREVREETGVPVKIVAKIPGRFRGSTGWTEYFVMEPDGEMGQFDPAETEAVRWVSLKEAPALLAQSSNEVGRDRDLAVLKAAAEVYEQRWD